MKKKIKKTEKLPSTEIVVILDMSGSMGTIRNDTIGGYNTFIDEQRKIPGECYVTLTMFDTVIEIPYENISLQDVKYLNSDTYKPRGATALLDAIGITLNKLESKKEKPDRYLVVIITDGEENSSKEFTNEAIKKMVETLRETKKYEFIFLGANIDSFATASLYGMSMTNSSNFLASSDGIKDVYGKMSGATTRYRMSKIDDDNSNLMQKSEKDDE